ncbi:hypothetical protein N0V93_004052 [Gnomoniopsis smithogilvyi]|uniref:F-box domain-containing protein n=1 Tax=Gnomoniopsis smithogilvyi TaxID=1191159 RepID=A0A9W8YY96_9PEZI|nr:hypothetical protein N0V93_004052 [Gnomoniopsis smithogilvyi]
MNPLMQDTSTEPDSQDRLLGLPTEVIRLICTVGILSRIDLKALRKTHARFEAITASFLFEDLSMSTFVAFHHSFFNICATPRLAKHVKRLVWYELSSDFLGKPPSGRAPRTAHLSFAQAVDQGFKQSLVLRRMYPGTRILFGLAGITSAPFLTPLHSRVTAAMRQLPNIHTFASTPLPSDTVLARTWLPPDSSNIAFPLTAYHARIHSLARIRRPANDGAFEFLLPALFDYDFSRRIRTLEVVEEPLSRRGKFAEFLGYPPSEGYLAQQHGTLYSFPLKIFQYRPRMGRSAFSHLTTIRISLHHHGICAGRSKEWVMEEGLYLGLAHCLERAESLEHLNLMCPDSEFWHFFLLAPGTNNTRKWEHLRSLELEGVHTSSEQLLRFVNIHASTLRHITLRDCLIKARVVRYLASIRNLNLYSFHVGGSSDALRDTDPAVMVVDGEDLLSYINRKTLHNPVEGIETQTSGTGDLLFITSERKWQTARDLVIFTGMDHDVNQQAPRGHTTWDLSYASYCHEDSPADSASDSSDTSEAWVWQNPPTWSWGRFYHEDPAGRVYYWETGPQDPQPRGYPTLIWQLKRADGTVIFTDWGGSVPAQPGEELFEDWDPQSGDRMEATPWRDLFAQSHPGHIYGDDLYAVRNRFETPPDRASVYKAVDDPAWLLQMKLAEVSDSSIWIEVRMGDLEAAKALLKKAEEKFQI